MGNKPEEVPTQEANIAPKNVDAIKKEDNEPGPSLTTEDKTGKWKYMYIPSS